MDNDDLVFSSDGVIHEDSDGNIFYSLRAQSQDLIDGGGSGTVGFYDVYQNGDIVESISVRPTAQSAAKTMNEKACKNPFKKNRKSRPSRSKRIKVVNRGPDLEM